MVVNSFLVFYEVLYAEVSAKHLQQHARNAEFEVGESGRPAAFYKAFAHRAQHLVAQHHQKQCEDGDLLVALRAPACGQGQQHALQQYAGQHGGRWHVEEGGVDERREHGGEQAHLHAILVGTHQGEEVDGQQDVSAVGHQVAQLRQQDVAKHEQGGEKVSSHFAKTECVKL